MVGEGRSWQQLHSIDREADNEKEDEAARPPSGCPNNGDRRHEGPGGALFCSFGGWIIPRDYVAPPRVPMAMHDAAEKLDSRHGPSDG
jgi:hypothetical protein